MKIGKDKIQHMALGLGYSLFFGFFATLVFAVLWELNDKRHGCSADVADITFTSIGGFVGGASHLWLMYQCYGAIIFP